MAAQPPRAVRLWALAFRHRAAGPPFYGVAIGAASTLVVLATYSCTIDVLCLMFGAIHHDTGLSRSTLSAFSACGAQRLSPPLSLTSSRRLPPLFSP